VFRFILFSPLLLAACHVSKNFQEQITHDFSGTWVSNSEGMRFEESWFCNENKLLGKGIICSDLDTLFTERLEITKRYGKWCYGATVENQNDGVTIFFKLKNETKQGEYVFSNKRHDFPQNLSYRFDMDTLYIQIEGIDNGAFKSEEMKLFKSPMRVP
jgi:hypothetical protein